MPAERRLYGVSVQLEPGGTRTDLLRIASVLHRRGTQIVEATLSQPAARSRRFDARFLAEPRQAVTTAKSLEGLVDVLSVVLLDPPISGGLPEVHPQ